MTISTRTKNTLIEHGLDSIESLTHLFEEDIRAIGVGEKGLFELKQCLKFNHKITLKKKPKQKLSNYHEAKNIVNHFLSHAKKINWGKEIKTAAELLKKYKLDYLLSIPPNNKIWTLSFFFVKDGQKYLESHSKIEKVIIETPESEKAVEEAPLFEYKKVEKPKSIRDFLGV